MQSNSSTNAALAREDTWRSATQEAPGSERELRFRDLLRGDLEKVHDALRTDPHRRNPVLRAIFALLRWTESSDDVQIELPFCPPLPILWAERCCAAGVRTVLVFAVARATRRSCASPTAAGGFRPTSSSASSNASIVAGLAARPPASA